MKEKPTHYSLLLLFTLLPLMGFSQASYPIFPEKNHTAALSLTAYSIDLNSVDVGYLYKLLIRDDLAVGAGIMGGIYYPRKDLSSITKEDLFPFVAPNVEIAYGSKHVFYLSFMKNFMKDDQAPFKSTLGYRHVFMSKQVSLKAYGSFLWIRDESTTESPTIYTHGGIGVGLERNF